VTNIANPPELKFGQKVLHGDTKTIHSDLVDIHKVTPHIKNLTEFQRRLIVKLN
jgi:hypothetical protein